MARQRLFKTVLRPSILDRYVAREFLISYMISILVVLSLRVMMDLLTMADEFIEDDVAGVSPGALQVLGKIVDYYGPQLFWYFRDFSGIIIVLASAFALVRMARQNEYVAVLASGVSLKRLIAPVVLLAFLLNLLMVADQELILPALADKLVRRHDETDRARKSFFYLLPDSYGALLSAREFDPDEQSISGMHVILRSDGQVVGQITADHARWDGDAGRWVLDNGLYFDNRTEDADWASNNIVPVPFYESDLSADFIWLRRHSGFTSLMSSGDLNQLLSQQLLKPGERTDVLSEKVFRLADPIVNMIMLLMGLPLLVSRQRRNTKKSVLLVFLGVGGCFVATFVCKLVVGEWSWMHPLVAGGLPIIIFLPMSVLALDGLKT